MYVVSCPLFQQAAQLQQQLQNGVLQYQRLQQVIIQMQAAQAQGQQSAPTPQQQQPPQQQQQQEPPPSVRSSVELHVHVGLESICIYM